MTKPKVAKKSSTATKHKIVGGDSGGAGGGGTNMNAGALKVLNVAAAISVKLGTADVPRQQVVMLAGIKAKSTFANALTKLKNADFITFTSQSITVTEKGKDAADVDAANVSIPATNADLHDSIKEQYKLKAKQIALFDHLADGGTYNKKEVQAALEINASSTWANLMTSLKKFGIVEYDRVTIKFTDDMFKVEGRPW